MDSIRQATKNPDDFQSHFFSEHFHYIERYTFRLYDKILAGLIWTPLFDLDALV